MTHKEAIQRAANWLKNSAGRVGDGGVADTLGDGGVTATTGMRTRWIIIGLVRSDTMLLRAGGWHRGWWINWRGYWDRFQCCEFLYIERLQAAVERRLAEAGLRLVSLASWRGDRGQEYKPLWAEVARQAARKDAETRKENLWN